MQKLFSLMTDDVFFGNVFRSKLEIETKAGCVTLQLSLGPCWLIEGLELLIHKFQGVETVETRSSRPFNLPLVKPWKPFPGVGSLAAFYPNRGENLSVPRDQWLWPWECELSKENQAPWRMIFELCVTSQLVTGGRRIRGLDMQGVVFLKL